MTKFIAWAEYHSDDKASEEADQVEWMALSYGSCPYDATQLEEDVSGAFVDYLSTSESEAEDRVVAGESEEGSIERKLRENARGANKKDLRRESLTANVKSEIERRFGLLGDLYPFEIGEGSISAKEDSSEARSTYIFCLKLAVDPEPLNREEFEDLVAVALKNYLGCRSQSQSFGWKGLPDAERPKRIKDKIEALSALTGEWQWNPDVEFPADPPPKLVKDLGLDVIAWIPSPDRRMGQIFLVAQCATGRTNWFEKLDDVNWDRIDNWIRPVPKGWSVRCFAIPFHVPNTGRFKDVSKQGGLFLDRARITLLFGHSHMSEHAS